ncbi:enoyl-CoA hydratase/isomerase family protein [Alsobacter sp. SYSU BS001988]
MTGANLCDLSVATRSSRFAHTDSRLGNSPIWYATQLLPLHMSDKRAREVIMLGRTYTAEDAERLGLDQRGRRRGQARRHRGRLVPTAPARIRPRSPAPFASWRRTSLQSQRPE